MEFKGRFGIMETEIIKINPRDIKLLEVNARFMKPEEYQKLVANIKKDGQLTSVPFCFYNENNQIEVLSGNHRVLASIDAELNEIEVMLCKDKLSKDQALAIQLSHNSISGQDDEELLRKLYGELESLEFKEYSGLTDEFINFCKEVEKDFKVPNLSYQALNLLFLPEETKEIKEVLESISDLLNTNHILTSMKDYDEYLGTTTTISKCLNIKNPSTTFLAMIRLVKENMDKLKEIAFNNDNIDNVPLSVILGRSDIDKAYAKIIDKALNRMISKGEIKKSEKEKGLLILAKNYLVK